VLVVAALVMLCPPGATLYAAAALADTAYDRWFWAGRSGFAQSAY